MRDEDEKVPPHLRGKTPGLRALQGATREDYEWFGEDGALDCERVDAQLFGSNEALRTVMLAVIDSYDVPERSREERLTTVMNALSGDPKRKGAKEKLSDSAILEAMAREFLRDRFGFSDKHRSLEGLYDDAAELVFRRPVENDDNKTDKKRVIPKFAQYRDRVLRKVSLEPTAEGRHWTARIDRALLALEMLGVRVRRPRGDN